MAAQLSPSSIDNQPAAFVTGAEGFLGRHVSRALSVAGFRVVGLGRPALPSADLASWRLQDTVHGDISESLIASAVRSYGEPAFVIHTAGSSSVGRSAADPDASLADTVGSTEAVIAAMEGFKNPSRLVFVSSAAIYGSREQRPEPIAVETKPDPISVYGRHKLMAERAVLAAAERGLSGRIVRLFSVYGPGLRKQLLWDVMTRVSKGESPLRLGGTGDETRDFLFVTDAAELILRLAQAKGGPIIVNGGFGRAISVRNIVSRLLRAMDNDMPLIFSGEARAGDPRSLVADIGCLDALGFKPETPLDEGLRRLVAWADAELPLHQRRTPTPTP